MIPIHSLFSAHLNLKSMEFLLFNFFVIKLTKRVDADWRDLCVCCCSAERMRKSWVLYRANITSFFFIHLLPLPLLTFGINASTIFHSRARAVVVDNTKAQTHRSDAETCTQKREEKSSSDFEQRRFVGAHWGEKSDFLRCDNSTPNRNLKSSCVLFLSSQPHR